MKHVITHNIPVVILLGMLLAICNTHARAGFIPWNSRVTVGDENQVRSHHHRHGIRPVYNGPSAAGYFMIRFFQEVVSPQDGPNCRFKPTCSRYGREAVERYGLLIGGFLAGDRIIRCNPYSPPGEDPLPRSPGEE